MFSNVCKKLRSLSKRYRDNRWENKYISFQNVTLKLNTMINCIRIGVRHLDIDCITRIPHKSSYRKGLGVYMEMRDYGKSLRLFRPQLLH